MKFDNKNFEKNVSDSLGTLEKLKSSLNFDKADKGLSELQTSFDKFDVSSFGRAIDAITEHFTFFGRVSDQIIRRLADGFVDVAFKAKNLVTDLSLGQVSAGWSKYEQKTESVQTILNATGASMEEVNSYLEKMMWFSDETSYGFTDMTAALGQMTSSGGKIDRLVPMIMGVANATAFAGKNAEVFSRVMYNLNQSYASGALKYQDWRSLEMAGVASKQLKQTIIDTAVELGRIERGQINLSNFNETLSEDWADQKVLEVAFGKFAQVTEEAYKIVNDPLSGIDTASDAYDRLAGKYDEIYYRAARAAQEAKTFEEALDATRDAVSSGWMKTFELIFGNYEEAKVLWTDLANSLWELFAKSAESRNELLEEWHLSASGGYQDFVESIGILLETLVDAKEVLSQIVYDILPDIDTPDIQNFVLGFKNFAQNMKTYFTGKPFQNYDYQKVMEEFNLATKKEAVSFVLLEGRVDAMNKKGEKFREAFAGIVHIVNILRKVIVTIFRTLSPSLKLIPAVLQFIVKVSAGLGHLFGLIDRSIHFTDKFRGAVESFTNLVVNFLDKWGDKIYDFFTKTFQFDEATGKIKIVSKELDFLKEKFNEFMQSELGQDIAKGIETIKNGLIDVAMLVGGVLTRAPEALPYIYQGITWIGEKVEWLFDKLIDFYSEAKQWFNDKGFSTWAKGLFNSVKDWVVPAANEVQKFFDTLTFEKVVAKAEQIWEVLKKIGITIWKGLAPIVDVIKDMFSALFSGDFEGFKNLMQGAAAALGGFAAVWVGQPLRWVGEALSDIPEAFYKEKIANALLKIAAAMLIFAMSFRVFSSIDSEGLTQALIALTALVGIISLFIKILNKMAGSPSVLGSHRGGIFGNLLGGTKWDAFSALTPLDKISNDILKLGASMMLFAYSLKIISKIDKDALKMAIVALAAILGLLLTFTYLSSKIEEKKSAKSMASIGDALKQFGAAAKIFALGGLFLTISVALAIMAGAIKLLGLLNRKDVEVFLTVFGALVIGIGVLGALAEKNKAGFGTLAVVMLSFAVAIMLIVPRIILLIGALAAIAALPNNMFNKIAAMFIGIVAAVMLLAAVTNAADLKGAGGLLAISVAIMLVGAALKSLAKIGILDLGKALLAIALALGIMAGISHLIKQKDMMGLFVMAGAIAIMVPAIVALSSLPLGSVLGALLAIAGAFGVMAIGMRLIKPVIGVLNSLSNALLKMGVAVLAISAGILVLALVTKLVAPLCDELKKSLPVILDTLWFVVSSLLDWLLLHAYDISARIIYIINEIIKGLNQGMYGPDGTIARVLNLVIDIIRSITDWFNDEKNLEKLYEAIEGVANVAIRFFLGWAARLAEKIPVVGADIAAALRGLSAYLTGQTQFSFKGSSFETLQTSDFAAAAIIIGAGKGTDPSVLGKRLEEMGYGGYTQDTYNELTKSFADMTDEQRSMWINKFIEARSSMDPNLWPYVDYTIAQLKDMGYKPIEKGQGLHTRGEGLDTGPIHESNAPTKHPTGDTTITKLDTLVVEEANINGDLTTTEKESEQSKEPLDSRNKLKEDYIIGSFETKVGLRIDSRFEGLSVKEAADKVGEIFATEGVEAGLAAYDDLTKNGKLNPKIIYPFYSEELRKWLIDSGVVNGSNYVAGIILGLKSKENELREATVAVTNNGMIKPSENTLQIKSPSKVAEQIGNFWDLGLANGIIGSAPSIIKASNDNAQGMINTMSYAAGEMVKEFIMAYSDIDNLGPITPVKSFGSRQAMAHLASVVENQNGRASGIYRRGEGLNSGPVGRNYTTTNYGGFTINVTAQENQNPKEIAQYVMDEIQSEMERREAALA